MLEAAVSRAITRGVMYRARVEGAPLYSMSTSSPMLFQAV